MERRISKKCETFLQEFKTNIKNKLDNSDFDKDFQLINKWYEYYLILI